MMIDQIKNFFKKTYRDLITINDSPHRIAGGFAVGVFFGVLPAAGPMAAVVLAWILRVNRVAAFVGGLLTNTWLSVLTFVVAVKIGAIVTGLDNHELYRECQDLLTDFHWRDILSPPVVKILEPLFAGYAVIALVAGLVAYGVAYWIVVRRRRKITG
jgi:uncharacterized protein (DUF2062 family)